MTSFWPSSAEKTRFLEKNCLKASSTCEPRQPLAGSYNFGVVKSLNLTSLMPPAWFRKTSLVRLMPLMILKKQVEFSPVPFNFFRYQFSHQWLSHSPQLVPTFHSSICPVQQTSVTILCLAMLRPVGSEETQLKVYSLKKQSQRMNTGAVVLLRSLSHFSRIAMSWSHSFRTGSSGKKRNLALRQMWIRRSLRFLMSGSVLSPVTNCKRDSLVNLPLAVNLLLASMRNCSSVGLCTSRFMQDYGLWVVRCVLETTMKCLLGFETHFVEEGSGAPARSGQRKYEGCCWQQTY